MDRSHPTYALVALLALGALLFAPEMAGAQSPQREVISQTAVPEGAFGAPIRDRVLSGARARATDRGVKTQPVRVYRAASDGSRVSIQVSAAYPPSAKADQALADYLGSLLHGRELEELHVFVATPGEIQKALCGPGVAACYDPIESTMFVAGQRFAGISVQYAVAHEYGHHVANYRNNDPWDALSWGPKYWASYEHVCAQTGLGKLYPDDPEGHYLENPGEAFAETYAQYHFHARWLWTPLLKPDAGTFRALRRDVRPGWHSNRTRRFRGKLSRSRRSKTFKVRLRLDGRLSLSLHGPRGSNYDLQLRYGRVVLDRTRRRGSRDSLVGSWCRSLGHGSEVARIRVVRRRGAGRFRLRVTSPG